MTKEAFFDRVMPEPNTGCWLWFANINPKGYGKTSHNGKGWMAHRLAYALWKGEIPTGMDVDHECNNRPCCNPDHLTPLPHKENLAKSRCVSTLAREKTHCTRGHLFDEANTGYEKTKYGRGRICRTCHREKDRLKYLRRKALSRIQESA